MDASSKAPFLVRNGLHVTGPMTATLRVKSGKGGAASIAWRTGNDKDFKPESRTAFTVSGGDEWQTYTVNLPVDGELIHLRFVTPPAVVVMSEFTLEPASGRSIQLW